MREISNRSRNGFTLLETLVATGILVTALAGLAQLFVLSARLTRQSGTEGVALVAAQSKLEELRSLSLAYAPTGEPVTDPALEPSPPASLREDIEGYVDALDESGRPAAEDGNVAFTRRWAVTPIDRLEPQAAVIEVCVFRAPAAGLAPIAADACLATIRSRQP